MKMKEIKNSLKITQKGMKQMQKGMSKDLKKAGNRQFNIIEEMKMEIASELGLKRK
ncbi:hypothetical protein Sgly_1742 [Syntrophobotulus glycolicus DSM 8271]|uniref:Uncharacterized protein n=1 Tax=Syntrophobotulus glycolicus (strain DSM 8271 / FlGlyR) TaxID=645991 RepID=F0SZ02_SYNGF|nr:hypothetical protein [Syntrophobotulus glycolicus]ADY56039.1 hypothetical protein Sgly_1742 [Syntrophobotulus glycolicus DSM 8271]